MSEPLLKWVGSKRWQVPELRTARALRGRRVVELFCGGAAVSFGLEPGRVLLNDANPHLINFYRWMQRGFVWTLDLESSEALYYDYRAWFNRLVRERRADTADGAQLFYYLNHHGFNGMCRFNKAGGFNVPFRPGRTCVEPDLAVSRLVLKNWQFTCDDFSDVLLEPDDFVYADPPYDGTFVGYTEGGWGQESFEELACLLRSHPGPVVIMNSATPWVTATLTALGYTLSLRESGQAMHRSRGRTDVIPEVMATNFRVVP